MFEKLIVYLLGNDYMCVYNCIHIYIYVLAMENHQF